MSENPKLFEQDGQCERFDAYGNPVFRPGVLSTEITLRDLFAAAALANPTMTAHTDGSQPPDDTVARWCYLMADAMLAERSKP